MPEYLLAIESSCDETAAAVIDRDRCVHSNIVATQTELHERFGGVVPEIASRAHLERILPVIDEAMQEAKLTSDDLSAIAVVNEPGLVGSLLVGLTAAKTLAWLWDLPLIAVNHIEAHLYACRMTAGPDVFPAIGLVISGGHTNLYDCPAATEFELVGSTIDDAAGEAFDKVAQLLGQPYPGGPEIEKLAATGNPAAEQFPRTFLKEERLDFSFSGLKTAVRYAAFGVPNSHQPPPPELSPQRIADLAASFQAAVIDVIVAKCQQALKKYQRSSLCVGGGVAANSALRAGLEQLAEQEGIRLTIAPREFCTDNAAMAGIAWDHFEQNHFADWSLDVTPGLVRRTNR